MRLTAPPPSRVHGAQVFVLALRPVVRAISWRPVALGAAAAITLIAFLRARHADPGATLAGVRAAALLLCAGLAFALDDPAASTLASSPTPKAARRGHRMVILLGLFVVLWGTMITVAEGLPLAAATLEAAAMLGVALGAAALAARSAPDGLGGIAGGPVLTLLLLATFVGQRHWPRWVSLLPSSPLDPAWSAAHIRWALLLAISIGVLMATARDPAASG
ncbi:MAG: hypothetical protein ABR540_04000 [Acidimicrobiales bacterium]